MSKHPRQLTDSQRQFIEKNHPRISVAQLARQLKVPAKQVRAYLKDRHKGESSAPLSPQKRRAFATLLVLLPVLFIVLLEIGLRLAGYGPNLKLFIPFPPKPAYFQINPEVGLRYFPATRVKPQVSYDVFLKQKPADEFRIFVLGGSSAAGYPYFYNGSFSSMLKVVLKEYYPDRAIQIVNLAMPAVGSYTVRDLALELDAYRPDLIIIYSGHNEFYGALGVGSSEFLGTSRGLINFFIRIRRYKIVQLTSDIIRWIRRSYARMFRRPSEPQGTLMARMVKKKYIPYQSADYRIARSIFEENLLDVVGHFRKRGVPVLMGTLVSNVHHQKPFVDRFSETGDSVRWRKLHREAGRLFRQGKPEAALEKISEAIGSDSLPASAYFLQGKILEALGDSLSAYRAYYKAKDRDALRFRASEDFNRVIMRLDSLPTVKVVDIKGSFEKHSPLHLPGNELLLEHLHPNLAGYRLMAASFARSIIDGRYLGTPERTEIPDSLWKSKIYVTRVDREVARIRIAVLMAGWPFTGNRPPSKEEVSVPEGDPIRRLALKFWREDITYEEMHVQAARYYESQGELTLAEQEYRALIQATPINPSPYNALARLLIEEKKLDEALPVLLHSIAAEPTAFACKMAGAILLSRQQVAQGIAYLEQAVRLDPNDPQALYNLSGAYALAGQFQKSRAVLDRLLRIAPNFPGAKELAGRISG